MTLALITVICTRCGEEMRLPQHVADLPADARLCGTCVQEMVHGLRVDGLEKAQARYIKAHSAVVNSFNPTQEHWDELDAAATEYNEAEQAALLRGVAEEGQ